MWIRQYLPISLQFPFGGGVECGDERGSSRNCGASGASARRYFCCPKCQRELSCYDQPEERRWRHLASCQFKMLLTASGPRVNCSEHGVRTATVPWAEKSSRFTLLFERLATDVLLATLTLTVAMHILRKSWDQTWQIMTRAVARGKAGRKSAGPLPRIGGVRNMENYNRHLLPLRRIRPPPKIMPEGLIFPRAGKHNQGIESAHLLSNVTMLVS